MMISLPFEDPEFVSRVNKSGPVVLIQKCNFGLATMPVLQNGRIYPASAYNCSAKEI